MNLAFMQSALVEKAAGGYLRTRQCVEYEQDGVICIDGKHFLNFSSNDYLGMRQQPEVLQAWVEGLAQFGAGSGASPLVTGYTRAHANLEAYLASLLNRDAVLLFNSGFAANQAVCQALFTEPGVIFADKFMHASAIDGALHSEASVRRFRHNDVEHLHALLEKHSTDRKLIMSEGVFSMDGDVAPVKDLVNLSEQFQAPLMLDDAHGFGVLGKDGAGTVESMSLSQDNVPILMATFGKAVGTAGAFIAGSQTLIDYLINFARHYIYSTAMPSAQAVATLQSLVLIGKGSAQKALQDNIGYFQQQASMLGIPLADSDTAIQPIIIGDPQKAVDISKRLQTLGIWVTAIRYPTVPKHQDRLRITLSAKHSQQDIEALLDALKIALGEQVCQ
ncbi:8-amino-7-oxononanoate synthase [Alteromonas sp. ASW11-130]|uniref:8-amino-7-oxononanoate synthase n=1 Tax=Alteromonas sp. ASW11-130 TaxID=3015775 RepID=UPI0022419CC6|nr:8-amino-7-oxononanoate synthase [Alteromonas sp. ASW11-130]MCW8091366.1 8-amino-7-oxononanoate synthase [Alteromonas sp. ASW11-130]